MSDTTVSSSQKTIQEIIDSNSKTNTRKTGQLGKDDFLNLLVTQLRYQDPLNPSDDKEFIGQMAQFSALEQMQNLNTSFTATKAYNLIGKNITATITDEKTDETSQITGDVSSIKVSSGKYYALVKGKEIPVEDITNVTSSEYADSSNLSAYTNLIGCNVNGIVYDSDSGDMIKVSGDVKSLQKGVYEDYAVMDGISAEISGLVDDEKSTDVNHLKNTLTTAYQNGDSVDIIIKDSSTGKHVPVTATLAKLNISDTGKITAVLNGVHVPIESITTITKPSASNTTSTNSGTGGTATSGTGTGGTATSGTGTSGTATSGTGTSGTAGASNGN